MLEIIQEYIDWKNIEEIYGVPKEKAKISVTGAKIDREMKELNIQLSSNIVIPHRDMKRLNAFIGDKLDMVNKITIDTRFEKLAGNKMAALKEYVSYMIAEANGTYAGVTETIKTDKTKVAVVDGDIEMTIYAVGDQAVSRLNKELSSKFSKWMNRDFGKDNVRVVFENDSQAYSDAQEKMVNAAILEMKEEEERQKKAIEQAKANPKPEGENKQFWGNGGGSGFRRRKKETPAEGDRIMGELIGDFPITPMSEVNAGSGRVAIAGTVFKLDERDIKNGKKLVTMLLTDKKTSMCAKAFTSPEKFGEIEKLAGPGTYVKIRGNAEIDKFDNALVIMIDDIEKSKIKKRTDNAEVKRVELHAHTKMSSMDGLTEVKDLVKTHEKWGHKAVAITDHGVVQGFPDAAGAVGKDSDMKVIFGMEGYCFEDKDLVDEEGNIDYKSPKTNHIILLVQNQTGMKNMYKMVSISHLNYFYKRPRLPKSLINQCREGIIVGGACEAGEVYRAVLDCYRNGEDPLESAAVKEIVDFYDYLEIQPLCNNQFLIEKEDSGVNGKEDLQKLNRLIIDLGKKYGKPVCATTDSHYAEPEDAIFRNILQAGMGYKDEGTNGLYLRTTEEMLEEFSYLGEELAYEVVVENTNKIADMIERVLPVPKEKYPPNIENAAETLKESCYSKAYEIYGNPLPEKIKERLEAELLPIIDAGYAVMYVAAQMLVKKSLSDGYLVGSRGSVGSSFAATMAGITEVNPLPPHYICPNCKNLEWGDENEYDCGVDMEDKLCPKCGTPYKKDGFSIPFQTFLGFNADKEPDIDLNFAGEYQPVAHKYVDEIFGAKNVFKAGTIGTIASKTAYGYVMKYYEEKGIPVNKYEVERLTEGCTGVKRTTGQHPGGIIIVPDDHEIYEFCPVQRPANDVKSDIVTTHFDYHKIDQNLLKLDILGHDVPSMIRHLQDMTGLDPLKDVPLSDAKVNSIFNGIEGLDIKDPDYRFTHGSYGVPEFGTKFTRQMLDDTHPTRFADFVRISGFSHGTDVWINNAQEWIKEGLTTIKDAISTRDDIMNYLILKGLPKKDAFKIMENVRKGKVAGGKCENWPEWKKEMEEHDVPEWYIESCQRIKYMFPRAHAVAYVMMSYRIAYFKVYYPVEFYATYFTTKVSEFDADTILKGKQAVLNKMDSLLIKGNNATTKEKDEIIVLEVAYEMYARGYEFAPAQLGISHATKFFAHDGKVLLPFVALSGVGENAAKALVAEYEKAPYETIEEMVERAGVNKTAVEALRNHGVLEGLPESDQLSFF